MKYIPADGCVDLRILATTDIHMNLSGFDYFQDCQSESNGLAGLAEMIFEARRTCSNCMVFDNGDMLQGTPLGDYIAMTKGPDTSRRHPAISLMNQIGYDATTLGNHDFSFGSKFLTTALVDATFPVVTTNSKIHPPAATYRHLILIRDFHDRQGRSHRFRIGVLGFLPPQTTDWDKSLRDTLEVEDILIAAQKGLSALQSQNPDVVIVLAHSGIGTGKAYDRMENAATQLAALDGIDVIIAGHIHRRFPAPEFSASCDIDPLHGALHGKPAVMAGFGGSHLGVIDLVLRPAVDGWRVAAFHSQAVPAAQVDTTALHPIIGPDHQATRRHFAQPVAESMTDLHSYFGLLGHDAGLALVNQAQQWHMRRAVIAHGLTDLPLLSATAPSRAGGRGGPSHYTQIPKGQLLQRHVANIYPFPNQIAALVITGEQLGDWLERAAGAFCQITTSRPNQPLLDPEFPCYNFDVFSGLEWHIDLTKPARYDASGQMACASNRISQLRYAGRKVLPQDRFILATNSYRLSSCGLYAPLVAAAPPIYESHIRNRDILADFLSEQGTVASSGQAGFHLKAPAGTTALFDTAPQALADLEPIARFNPRPLGLTPEGFLRLQLCL